MKSIHSNVKSPLKSKKSASEKYGMIRPGEKTIEIKEK